MEVITRILFTDWSTSVIAASTLLVIVFVVINVCGWLLDKVPVPPGRKSDLQSQSDDDGVEGAQDE